MRVIICSSQCGRKPTYPCGCLHIRRGIFLRGAAGIPIPELKTVYDHCRLRLRSGEVFLARWAPAGGLRLEKIGLASARAVISAYSSLALGRSVLS